MFQFCKSPITQHLLSLAVDPATLSSLYPKSLSTMWSSGVKLDHWCREEL